MYYPAIMLLVVIAIFAVVLLAVHVGFRAPRRVEHGSPADYDLAYEEIYLQGVDGKRLFAWWLPVAEPAPAVIMLHGWGGNAELMLPLALPLNRAGLNVLLLDARNHGRSDSASFSSLPRFAEDAGTAVDWVRAHGHDPLARIVLLGHSVGAGAVLLEASRRNDIAAVISIAAFAHPEWMMRRYLERYRIPDFCKPWILHYVEWVIGYRFDEIAPMHTACRIHCPVLLVHGTEDETVPVSDAQAIRNNCHDNRPELLLIEDGRHDSVEEVEHHADQLIAFLDRVGIAAGNS
jgi:alpha-beta hydrolase superfamily lysophospholipase